MDRLTRETMSFGASVVVSRAVVFLLIPLYAHTLSPPQFGVAVIITSLLIIATIVITAGQDVAAARWYWMTDEVSERKRWFASSAWIQLGAALALTVMILAVAEPLAWLLLGTSDRAPYLRFAALTLLPSTLIFVARTWLRLAGRPIAMLALTTIIAALTLGFALLFLVGLDMDLGSVYLAIGLASLAGAAIAALLLGDWLSPRHVSFPSMAALAAFGSPAIIGNLGIWVIDLSDRFLVRIFDSAAEVGRYQLCSTLAAATSLVVAAFEQAWTSHALSAARTGDYQDLYNHTLLRYVSVVGGIALLVTLTAPITSTLISPDHFELPISVISLLAFAFMLTGVREIFALGAVLAGTQRGVTGALIAGAVINVLLNLILIPRYGIVGAGVSTLIAQGITVVGTFVVAQRLHHVKYSLLAPTLIMACALGAGIVFSQAPEGIGSRSAVSIVSLGVFAGAVYFGHVGVGRAGSFTAWRARFR